MIRPGKVTALTFPWFSTPFKSLQMDAPDKTAAAATMELSGDDDLAGTQT
jgi:hypothetical protein